MRGRHNTCQTQKADGTFVDKINYKSQSTAERSAIALTEKRGRPFDAYQCFFCGGWHIGNSVNLTFSKFWSIFWVWILRRKRTGLKDRPWIAKNTVATDDFKHQKNEGVTNMSETSAQGNQLKSKMFFFGSNNLGIHGAGAAFVARRDHGAILHQGFGPQGNSFGIPTCSKPTGEPGHDISFEDLKFYIQCSLLYAEMHPEKECIITQIGCGLAGWTAEQVAPLFAKAPENCLFDTAWEPFLGKGRKYWGHV
jgi:hypothetical protein